MIISFEMSLCIPRDVWSLIIEFAYDPLKRGWYYYMWRLCLVSKMHNSIVKELFRKFAKNPIFPDRRNFFTARDVINYLIRDAPVIKGGFYVEYVYNGKRKTKFSFKNCINDNNFFDNNDKRFFVAKHYSQFRLVNGYYNPTKAQIIKLDHPIIIIPFHNDISGAYVIDYHFIHTYYNTTNIEKEQKSKKYYFTDTSDLLKILRYVMDTNNSIPSHPDILAKSAITWYDSIQKI